MPQHFPHCAAPYRTPFSHRQVVTTNDARLLGRIGGLTAWSRNDQATMVGPAHRGFRARFERLVDSEGKLDPIERTIRADRARRAYMLMLATKSAEARRKRKLEADPAGKTS